MPALERLHGVRVVADPAAIDAMAAALPTSIIVIRSAPDDAFAIGATDVEIDDDQAIVEEERGFVGGWCGIDAIRPHIEWSLPVARPALAQGSIAGVPAKLWILDDDRVLLLTAAAYAATLAERLGWSRP